MLRKAGFVCALMLSLPTFANAWTITAKIGSGAGTITSDSAAGTVTKTATGAATIGYFKTVDNTVASQHVTVTPDNGNYLVSSVIVDGANVTASGVNNVFTVNAGAPVKNHSLVVYYTAVTSGVTVTQAAGGAVSIQHLDAANKPFGAISRTGFTNLKAGSKVRVFAAPNSDYKVASINGTPVTALQGDVKFADVTVNSNTTVTAAFTLVPSITANLLPLDPATNRIGFNYKSGATVKLDASSTHSNDAVSYSWSATGVTVANTNTAINTIVPKGNCSVTVTVTSSSDATVVATKTINLTVQDAGTVAANVCTSCHNQRNAQIVADFNASPHWTNLRNNGDSAVAGDGLGSCATNKCHFKSVEQPGCSTCHAGKINADGTFAHYSATHQDFATLPTQNNTCFLCHQGSHHGTPTAAYQKSSHYLNPYGEGIVGCVDCHNPHSTTATFPSYNASYTKTADGSCEKCHTGQYGIFNADGTMKTSHSASKQWTVKNVGSTTTGWYTGTRNVYLNISASFVTPSTTCSDCHGHNNQVNAEYAETMHADPYGRWKGTQYFKFRGFSSANATTITHANSATDGCVRCHTTTGFVNFVDSNFNDLRAWGFKDTSDKTSEVISCRACHVTGAGKITGEAEVGLPEGNVNGWNPASIRAYNKPYPAYYNYSSKLTGKYINSTKGATGTALQYRDFKNSNVCIPCHSGRSGNSTNGDVIKALASFSGFTTLAVVGNAVPGAPHGVWQAAVLDGKIGYQFTKYTTAANGHATLGVGGVVNTGTTAGPCVTCHMDTKTATGVTGSASYRKHNFEIRDANGAVPAVCSSCHSTNFNAASLDDAKSNFGAAVSALGEILANPSLNKYGVAVVYYDPSTSIDKSSYKLVMPTASRMVVASQTPAQTAELAGAYYNLKLLYGMAYGTAELGDWAHNPQYLKQLTYDTINAVRATTTGSVPFAISQIPAAATGTVAAKNATAGFTALQAAAATTALTNPSKHYVAGATKVQYMASNTVCATCHNPAETDLQKTAREAWAESGHGVTTGPWNKTTSSTTVYNGTSITAGTTDPCIRCHIADAFINFTQGGSYSNVAAITRTDAASVNTPLNCNVCHVSPLNSTNDRRSIAQVPARAAVFNGMSGVGSVAYYNYSSYDKISTTTKLRSRVASSFPDVHDSNVCIPCHSGHGLQGKNLAEVASNANFNPSTADAGLVKAASMAPVAGMMYAKLGFINFSTITANPDITRTNPAVAKTLISSIDLAGGLTSTHRNFGTKAIWGDSHSAALFGTKANPVTGNFDEGGPCVTCHMKGNLVNGSARSEAGHSFEINQDAFIQVCSKCHTSENGNTFAPDGTVAGNAAAFAGFQNNFLEPNAEVYADAQVLAKLLLKQKYGIYVSGGKAYENSARSTQVTDWTRATFMTTQSKSALTKVQATKLMGAVFNVVLCGNEPAAYAHARTYTRRLVYDTLDYLDDGVMNLSVGASAVAASQAAADADFSVFGKYVKDTNAYNSVNNAITTPYGTTSEDMLYVIGWDRKSGVWTSVERP